MEPGKARPKRHQLSRSSSSLTRLKPWRGSSSEVLFAPNQSICESTALAEKCLAGCCCLPEPRLSVRENRIQRKPLCLCISPWKAQHSLGNHSWVWGCCCCFPELVSAARWKIPAWSEILLAVASPLPEREPWSYMSVHRAPQDQVWGRRSTPPPWTRMSRWPWVRETLGKQDSLPWHEQQAGGKTSVTRSLCGEMEAWLLRRHEGTTRAGSRAPH